ncbi:craniofacial development protein 2-like [Macrobrachium nipponense]|uniref:craniofacial development protein 2-like n=1 Tax=Macrobrachium nipponense TaxID=159736 RepID=UPI0030C7A388
MQGLPHRERVLLKKRARELRVGTLNVGTMTGRGRAIADLIKMRRVDILCVRETRWKGNKARELGDGYKMFYSGANKEGRNGVGIILSSEMKKEIVEVNRRNDRIIWVRLMVENCTVNIFSAYAPQTGCLDEEKDHFWLDFEEEMEKVPANERCLVGGDLNGHVGQNNHVISRIHGGYGYDERNAEGERIVDFPVSKDMVLANTFFTKRQEHLVTYKSGGRSSQIDYLMYKRKGLHEVKDCKVIPGDHVSVQHRLVVMDLVMEIEQIRKKKMQWPKRIKWFKLKEIELCRQFKEKVLEELTLEIEDVDEWWNRTMEMILRVAREILGENSGKMFENKETWWFSEEVKDATKAKESKAKKMWENWMAIRSK